MNASMEEVSVGSDKECRNEEIFIAGADEAIVESKKEHWNYTRYIAKYKELHKVYWKIQGTCILEKEHWNYTRYM